MKVIINVEESPLNKGIFRLEMPGGHIYIDKSVCDPLPDNSEALEALRILQEDFFFRLTPAGLKRIETVKKALKGEGV